MLINFAEKESPQRVSLRPCSDERQKGLNCLKLKQNSFKPLKQSMFTSTTKHFKCFRQFEKMHLEKTVKQKRKLFRQRIEAATRGVL